VTLGQAQGEDLAKPSRLFQHAETRERFSDQEIAFASSSLQITSVKRNVSDTGKLMDVVQDIFVIRYRCDEFIVHEILPHIT